MPVYEIPRSNGDADEQERIAQARELAGEENGLISAMAFMPMFYMEGGKQSATVSYHDELHGGYAYATLTQSAAVAPRTLITRLRLGYGEQPANDHVLNPALVAKHGIAMMLSTYSSGSESPLMVGGRQTKTDAKYGEINSKTWEVMPLGTRIDIVRGVRETIGLIRAASRDVTDEQLAAARLLRQPKPASRETALIVRPTPRKGRARLRHY